MYAQDDLGRIQSFIAGRPDVTRRQDLPAEYSVNGALYLAKTEWLLQQGGFIGAETLSYVMPVERSVDLDTPQDWR